MGRAKFRSQIVMKFCVAIGIRDVITHANFGHHRFRRFRMARVEFQTFPLNFVVVLISASLPCQCVIKFTRGQLYPPVCKNDSHGFLLLISISQCISLFLLSLIIKSRTRLAIKNKTGRLAAINNDSSHSLIVGRLQRTLIATRQTWTDFILIA